MHNEITAMLTAARRQIADIEQHSPSTEAAIDHTLGTYLDLAGLADAIEQLQRQCKDILMTIALETGTTAFEGSSGCAYTTKTGTTIRASVPALQSLAARRPDIAEEIAKCLEVKPTGGTFTITARKRP